MTKRNTLWILVGVAACALFASTPLFMWAQDRAESEHDMAHMSEHDMSHAHEPAPAAPRPAAQQTPASSQRRAAKPANKPPATPEQAQAPAAAAQPPAGEATTYYTCSMHPQIVEDHPGTCPICGMDLTVKNAEPAQATAPPSKQRKIKYWVAPMDPTYIRDKPGKSPMGMDLVPVYEEAQASGAGTVTIDPVVVQNMGVRIASVERGPIFRHVRTIGSVDVAEDEVSVVNLRYSGWIERIYVDETGAFVKKGQRLFDVYSPELVSAASEYLMSLRGNGADSPLATSARSRLQYLDLSNAQIAQIARAGKAPRTISVTAPRSGYVLHKNVVQGARVQSGVDLYRIGSLEKIWVNADIYEFDAPWVEVGQRATMELSFEAGKRYEGRVSYIYPTLNPKTRTLTVRLEFENPGIALKPGMFATVQIETQRKADVLKVPTEAIIHSGTRQIVFVATGLGKYAMREITTGLTGDRYVTEVRDGLSQGERVVISGQFLLDSESQLQEAVEKLMAARLQAKEPSAQATTPQTGAPGAATPADAPASSAPTQAAAGEAASYWTCSMHPQVVQDHPGTCPICGMTLVEKKKPSSAAP